MGYRQNFAESVPNVGKYPFCYEFMLNSQVSSGTGMIGRSFDSWNC